MKIRMDYTVSNPEFYSDVIQFLDLNLTEEEVKTQVDKINNQYPLNEEML